MGAQQRREDVLEAALAEFSHRGLHGGSTITIAREAGLSHPNLFRLFATKKELFLAVLARLWETVEREMLRREPVGGPNPTAAMEDAWGELMARREVMLMMLQGYAASHDADIRDLMHRETKRVFEHVEAIPGAGTDKAHDFVANGMYYMVAVAMDLPARAADDPWADRFLSSE